MDSRIKKIKKDLNLMLGVFDFPADFHAIAALNYGLIGDHTEEENKCFSDRLTDFEQQFVQPFDREQLIFSEDEFDRRLLSELITMIYYSNHYNDFGNYYRGVLKGVFEEGTADRAFELYAKIEYNSDSHRASDLFLFWNILLAEKLPEFILKKLEALIKL